jgi:hypothetical protein
MSDYDIDSSFLAITPDLRPGAIVRYMTCFKRSFNLPPSGSRHCFYLFGHLRLTPSPHPVRSRPPLQKIRESRRAGIHSYAHWVSFLCAPTTSTYPIL